MMPRRDDRGPEETRRQKLRFAMKLQQYTGPVQAKGIEDTAFYRSHVLISVNEVGSDPARLAGTVRQLHESNLKRADEWPRSILATATHDTKRGEDARARIDVLSEVPEEWEAAARAWAALNRPAKAGEAALSASRAPDADDEYLFYQALLGAWDFARQDPESLALLRSRLQAYLLKAGREAKLKSSWIAPNAEYEKAVSEFVARAFENPAFLDAFRPFARRVGALGALSSLSRTVLKIASPGVADFFQGAELWDLSLVDPDNRRPVDFAERRAKLRELEPLLCGTGDLAAEARRLLERWEDGRVKLFVTARALRARRERADLFLNGAYVPLGVRGGVPDRFIAFERVLGEERAIAVVPRLAARALWNDGLYAAGSLAQGASLELDRSRDALLQDVFTGAVLPADGSLEDALSFLPFALFVSRS
jgi:(1->4)-alpha-D-glucan 1-alpha-D-glucosylmutase